MNSVKQWLHGLVSAFIGGAAASLTTLVIAPETFNFGEGWRKLMGVAGVNGLVTAAAYLKQSPLPTESVEVTITRSVEVKDNTEPPASAK